MPRFLLLCFLLLVPLEHAQSHAQRRPPCLRALMIADFDGPPADYRFYRTGRPARLAIFAPLQTGDQLEVVARSRSLTVQMADRSTRTLRGGEGPRCIVRPGGSVSENALREFGELLTERRLGRWYGISRGDGDAQGAFELGLPDVAAGRARVGAGVRPMGLPWHGGEPPFTVEVIAPGGRRIVHEEGVYPRLLLLNSPLRLVPGEHRVRVRDARGMTAEGSFRAGRFETAPSAPASAEAALLVAGALYQAGPDRTFDAFLVLSPFYREETTVGWMMALLTEPREGRAAPAR